jgi:phosphoglycolate phosphatase
LTQVDLVLFDCDGTLVDSQNMIVAAMDRAFAAHGLAILPRARVLSIVGLSLSQAIGVLLGDAESTVVEAVAASYRDAFGELRSQPKYHEPLFVGADELLADLNRRPEVVLGLATGKSRRGVQAILQMHGLQGIFQTVQTADTHPSKPHPSMIDAALLESGADRGRAVIIGDTSFDMQMGAAAGIATVGVEWGYHPVDQLVAGGAGDVVCDFDHLRRVLRDRFDWGTL